MDAVFLPRPVKGAQRHRADVRAPQELPPYRHVIRPIGHQPPRCRLHRSKRQLLIMSPQPKFVLSDHLHQEYRIYTDCR